jgi:hypothetical protein
MSFEFLHGTRVRTSHPYLEEMEGRLLPGDTVGLGVLASSNLFGALDPPLSRNEELSIPGR